MRSPVSVSVAAAAGAVSPWLVLDYLQRPFDVALFVELAAGATATYTVQHTPDNPNNMRTVGSLTRTAAVATLGFVDHGLSVGDSIVVQSTGDANFEGTYQVASTPDKDTLTYAVANAGALLASPNARVALLRVFPHTYMAALTARADGNYGAPCWATRLLTSAGNGGRVTLQAVQGLGRG